ncbi:MAG: hypothetical protein KAJ19_25300, partial [Gammaproteobacteria bacterium]|nr:hypothetical protein [Gammaproteobacteria bacterium]
MTVLKGDENNATKETITLLERAINWVKEIYAEIVSWFAKESTVEKEENVNRVEELVAQFDVNWKRGQGALIDSGKVIDGKMVAGKGTSFLDAAANEDKGPFFNIEAGRVYFDTEPVLNEKGYPTFKDGKAVLKLSNINPVIVKGRRLESGATLDMGKELETKLNVLSALYEGDSETLQRYIEEVKTATKVDQEKGFKHYLAHPVEAFNAIWKMIFGDEEIEAGENELQVIEEVIAEYNRTWEKEDRGQGAINVKGENKDDLKDRGTYILTLAAKENLLALKKGRINLAGDVIVGPEGFPLFDKRGKQIFNLKAVSEVKIKGKTVPFKNAYLKMSKKFETRLKAIDAFVEGDDDGVKKLDIKIDEKYKGVGSFNTDQGRFFMTEANFKKLYGDPSKRQIFLKGDEIMGPNGELLTNAQGEQVYTLLTTVADKTATGEAVPVKTVVTLSPEKQDVLTAFRMGALGTLEDVKDAEVKEKYEESVKTIWAFTREEMGYGILHKADKEDAEIKDEWSILLDEKGFEQYINRKTGEVYFKLDKKEGKSDANSALVTTKEATIRGITVLAGSVIELGKKSERILIALEMIRSGEKAPKAVATEKKATREANLLKAEYAKWMKNLS